VKSKDYLHQRPDSGIYFYARKVPKMVQELDGRTVVRKDLGTRDEHTARTQARALNEANEALWASLLAGQNPANAWERYENATRIVAAHGFGYRPTAELLSSASLDEVLDRIEALKPHLGQKPVVDAMLGTVPEPQIMLSEVWTKYAEHSTMTFMGMSENQMRKHRVPRERAVAYAVACIGDKALPDVTRQDVLKYRTWWEDKVRTEKLKADTINRSFSDMKGMLTVIDQRLQTDYHSVWDKTRVKATNATKADKRLPFANAYVEDVLLQPTALDELNFDARMIFYAMVETGLSPSEACNLRPEDIVLEHKIPHINLPEREDRRLKSDYRPRVIPLVGVSLWAFKQAPGGFPRYHDKEDNLSTLVNRRLDDLKLRPSKAHQLYSLRHTFQDRILKAKALDRVQADLMGHEFERPAYGEGADLELKLEVLQSIMFKWKPPAVVVK
jgi:integrase